MKKPKMPLIARFYQKVKVGKPNECWEWQGATIQNGYGQIGKGSKVYYAHRISYELHHGPIPEGMYVCHSCDNRRCVNPNHLWVGTAADNMMDASQKNRLNPVCGEASHHAKLTSDAVIRLRTGQMAREEAIRAFGVNSEAIRLVLRGKTWKHLDA